METEQKCPVKQAALIAPNHIAVVEQHRVWTYLQFDQYIDMLGPFQPGQMILSDDNPSMHKIALFFAAWRHGANIFPVNPKLPVKPQVPLHTNVTQSLFILTSGSTKEPKIAVLSLQNLIANAQGTILPLKLKTESQWLLSLPLYHVGGIAILIRTFLAMATISLIDSPNITHISYIPTHLYRSSPVHKNLQCILLGGAPIPPNLSHRLPIHTTYGLTEMGSMVTLDGRVLEDRELRIDESGEIWVRGKCLFQGYFPEMKRDDWFPTGDLGAWTDKGLVIKGRKDWMFISGGENIQPEEVEMHLLAHPDILEAAVMPKEDPEFGKRPVAFVKANKRLEIREIQAFLRDRLAKFKMPVEIHYLDEIPKKNNKTDRSLLAATASIWDTGNGARCCQSPIVADKRF